MISPDFPTGDQVLTDLGVAFIARFVEAVDGCRDDHMALRAWRPDWSAASTQRTVANFLHDRIWDRFVKAIGYMDDIHVTDQEPVRELRWRTRYTIRIKRHHPGDRISSYPTEGSSAFWSNSGLTLEGLESYSLAIGYMWHAEVRSVGDAVLSFRDGTDNPVWAVRLLDDSASSSGFTWEPIEPNLPEIDLSGVAREVEKEPGV